MKTKPAIFITQTAVMLALLMGTQFITKPLGQFVTGSLVNLILLISVFIVGIRSGIIVAALSNFLAFLVGMGPVFIQIVPFVAVGNVLLVVIANLVRKHMTKGNVKDVLMSAAGLVAASIAKFLFLWLGLVMIALPFIPGIKEQQIAMISAAFSWPQLVTALIGSALSMMIVPLLKRAIKAAVK